MPLTNISLIKDSISGWETAEYIAIGLVILGVAGEYIADFTKLLGSEEKRRRLGKYSTLLLIVALAVEGWCLIKTNQLSGPTELKGNVEYDDPELANAPLSVRYGGAGGWEVGLLTLQSIDAPRSPEFRALYEALINSSVMPRPKFSDKRVPAGKLLIVVGQK